MNTPNGKVAVIEMFGNPMDEHGQLDRHWEESNIAQLALPSGYVLRYNGETLRTIRFHRRLHSTLSSCLEDIWAAARSQVKKERGYHLSTSSYDHLTADKLAGVGMDIFSGSYVFRKKRGGHDLSLHSYGIAIDFDSASNAMGTSGRMPSWVVRIFEDHGFVWGGRWRGKNRDPMHFQFASGV